jgi:2-polyprenyl-3-methyl-5-hydroxy-6-metoxy-1,4-benzoquinol methylase
MKNIQQDSNKFYANNAANSNDKTTIAGRYSSDSGKEADIANFILSTLRFTQHNSFLDIGCGYGYVTDALLTQGKKNSINTTLIDIPEVLDKIKREQLFASNTQFIEGNFPNNLQHPLSEKFDHILIYSVLHCVNNPELMIEKAVKLLTAGGRLLIGDIPNITKKGRFLASNAGRSFDANYKNIPLEDTPLYENSDDFIEKNKEKLNTMLTDEFASKIFNKYRRLGYNVYLIEQPNSLPFSKSREDILIVRE